MAEWAATFGARFEEQRSTFSAQFGTVYWIDPHPCPDPPDPYEGPYEVIPKFMDQILETREKSMADDVTVKEIPVDKVTNVGGGYTVTIGG